MDIIIKRKKLVGVEYPGIVVNESKMIETLGGLKEISEVYSDAQKRLELRFRSSDPYCKCAHGDRVNTTNLLLNVIVRKTKTQDDCEQTEIRSVEVCGTVSVSFKFKGYLLGSIMGPSCLQELERSEVMNKPVTKKLIQPEVTSCRSAGPSNEGMPARQTTFCHPRKGFEFPLARIMDFQISPMERSNDQYTSLLPQIVPSGLHESSWIERNSSLFILPQLFSRFDVPNASFYKSDGQPRNPEKSEKVHLPPNIIGRTRQRRAGFAIFVNFEDEKISSTPMEQSLTQLKIHPCEPQLLSRIKQAFEERPIWSRNALSSKVDCEKIRLKFVLPAISYHFNNGPWRTLWVKFGYDPRKDPSSKVYQTLDFRFVSVSPDDENFVKARRKSNRCLLLTKCNQNQPRVAVIKADGLAANKATTTESNSKTESDTKLSHEFHSGCLPVNRQSFFQLCDVYLVGVQNLVHSNDGREITVHDKDGWCEPGILDKCRELISQDIKNTMSRIKALKY